MARRRTEQDQGPFRADQLREGDEYELSRGHPIWCAPQGQRGSQANLAGGEVVDTDADVESAGLDPGFSPEPGTLRAPDVAVGNLRNEPGWGKGAPLLALEYADTGRDEAELQRKIQDLLEARTRVIWVARLVGPRRVEVYEPGQPLRVMVSGEELRAPGILRNPVPVDALFERKVAHEIVLRNLLQRRGYESLDQVRAEGEAEGKAEGEAKGKADALLAVFALRGLAVTEEQRGGVLACRDLRALDRWIARALTAASVAEALA
ncbi:MAG: Uma2 family endonuclease [Deltaproteobacteria bacterium]|nr:Uma2 family endonuclease [Deltaproteobacteria bacterium]